MALDFTVDVPRTLADAVKLVAGLDEKNCTVLVAGERTAVIQADAWGVQADPQTYSLDLSGTGSPGVSPSEGIRVPASTILATALDASHDAEVAWYEAQLASIHKATAEQMRSRAVVLAAQLSGIEYPG